MPSSIEIETPENETPEIETHETTDPQPTFPVQMPTPRPTASGEKRTAVVLSPLTNACENEEMVKVIEATIQKTVESTIKVSLENSMPIFIAKIQDEVQKTMVTAIDNALAKMKRELQDELMQKINSAVNKTDLKAMAHSEELEQYNRRENLRISGIPEATFIDQNGTTRPETSNASVHKVVELGRFLESEINEQDISIAHRLPTKKPGHRQLIVRFSRRITKINILQNKKNLAKAAETKDVKIYEDLTAPRLRFFNMMKLDHRIESLRTKEGNIFFTWKNNKKMEKISNLFDGGHLLNYYFNDVWSCFSQQHFSTTSDTSNGT